MDHSVTLSEQEWRQVVNAVCNQPWYLANPILMKFNQQIGHVLAPTDQRMPTNSGAEKLS